MKTSPQCRWAPSNQLGTQMDQTQGKWLLPFLHLGCPFSSVHGCQHISSLSFLFLGLRLALSTQLLYPLLSSLGPRSVIPDVIYSRSSKLNWTHSSFLVLKTACGGTPEPPYWSKPIFSQRSLNGPENAVLWMFIVLWMQKGRLVQTKMSTAHSVRVSSGHHCACDPPWIHCSYTTLDSRCYQSVSGEHAELLPNYNAVVATMELRAWRDKTPYQGFLGTNLTSIFTWLLKRCLPFGCYFIMAEISLWSLSSLIHHYYLI